MFLTSVLPTESRMMKSFICFAAVVALASAALECSRKCPVVQVQDPFLLSNFSGTWYKQYALNTPWELGTCIQSTYTLNETSGELAVDSTIKTILNGGTEVRGVAVQTNTSSTEGRLTLTLSTYFGDVTGDMWILSTDYDNYAVVYSCRQVTLAWWSEPFESVWVLTRERNMSSDIKLLVQAAMAVISHDGGPSFSQLVVSPQDNCS